MVHAEAIAARLVHPELAAPMEVSEQLWVFPANAIQPVLH
jgi:hypothetical protein